MARAEQRRGIMKATLSVVASRALGFPLALLVNAWLARVLTREEFAFFGVLAAFSVLFALFAQGGYQTLVVRQMAEAEAGEERLHQPAVFYASTIATLMLGMLLAGLFYLFGRGILPGLGEGGNWLFLLAAVLLVARSLNIVTAQALRGLGKVGASANLSGHGAQGGVVRCILMLAGFGLAMATSVLTLEMAIWISIGASVICSLWSAVLALRHSGWKARTGEIGQLISSDRQDKFDMMLSEALFYWVTASAVMIIGGLVVDAAALAGLVAAFQIRIILTSPMTMIAGAVPGILIRQYKEGDLEELQRSMRWLSSTAFVICVTACAVLLALGPAGLKLIFGSDYGDAYYHLAIITIGILSHTYCGLAGQALLWFGSPAVHRSVMIKVLLVTTPAYFALAHYFGAYGLSVGLVISILLQNVMLVRAVEKTLGVKTHAHLDPREYAKAFSMVRKMIGEKRAGR